MPKNNKKRRPPPRARSRRRWDHPWKMDPPEEADSRRNSGEEEEDNRSEESAGSASSSKSLLWYQKSTTEIEYCIRTINLIISTLRLPIRPLNTLNELTMENLVRIHCALLGIRFSEEFIPSSNPREDAERMILSLKDRFGADKFGSLDADKIAQKNPTQIRFLLENFHLILNYQLAQEKRSKEIEMVKSDSGNHLSVRKPSFSDAIGADSFYVLPPLKSREDKFPTNFDDTDDSFQTVENVVINVYEESSSDEPTKDPLFKKGVNRDTTQKPPTPQAKIQKKPKKPMTSSPVPKKDRVVCPPHAPNLSAIKHSHNALGYLNRTVDTTKAKYCKEKQRSQSLSMQRNNPQTRANAVEVLSKNPNFGKRPFTNNASKQNAIVQKQPKSNETQFLSESEDSESDPDAQLKKLRDLRDAHSSIRKHLSESLICIDKDILQLMKKPPNTKTELNIKRPPFFPWLIPVDCRFPNYTRGVIIPKCTTWRQRQAVLEKSQRAKKKNSQICFEVGNSRALSTQAQQGSQHYEMYEEELYDE